MKKVAAFVLVSLFLASMAVVNPPQVVASTAGECKQVLGDCRKTALESNAGFWETTLMLARCKATYWACLAHLV
jgi:hypothetical protein